jgi:dienelactone hydrolase
MREPVVLENDGQKIFAVIHRPAEGTSTPRPAVAIFHGLVGSKDQPHRLYVKLAEALARAGMVALRTLARINTLREIGRTHAPLLIVYGTEDEVVTAASVGAATQMLAQAGIRHEVAAIDGADHVFM